jgi:creatinine amidohydrolase
VFTVDVFALDLSDHLLDPESPMHGGELDTSLLLYLSPGLVRMDLAQDFLPPDPRRHVRGLTKPLPALSPGSLGRPTLATADKGERIYKIILERVASRVLASAPTPVPQPAPAPVRA